MKVIPHKSSPVFYTKIRRFSSFAHLLVASGFVLSWVLNIPTRDLIFKTLASTRVFSKWKHIPSTPFRLPCRDLRSVRWRFAE